MSKINITMSDLVHAAGALAALGNIRKEGVIALKLANYRVEQVDVAVRNSQEAEQAVFASYGIEADDAGVLQVKESHKDFDAVVAELTAIRESTKEIEALPVPIEEIVESADKFENNPVSENILVALGVLYTGSPVKEVH